MIRTERLTLRPCEIADYDAYAGAPMTGEEAWIRVLRFTGHWSMFGYGQFAVLSGRPGGIWAKPASWTFAVR